MADDGIISYLSVSIKNIYGTQNPAQMKIIERTLKQRFMRAAKRTGKIYGAILLILPVAAFVHILLLISAFVFLATSLWFFWALGDKKTFEYVEGECPTCHSQHKLKPYANSRFRLPVDVHCSQCGGTFTVP